MSELSAYNVSDPLTEEEVNEIDVLRAAHPELLALPYPLIFHDHKTVSGRNATAFAHGWHWRNSKSRDLWLITVEQVTQ